jgi:hypothetical protein
MEETHAPNAGLPSPSSVPFDDVLRTVRKALDELLHAPEFGGVYHGPWWSVPLSSPPGEAATGAAWKCAVLRRRPNGADHEGHLFLVVAAGPAAAELHSERWLGELPVTAGRVTTIPIPLPAANVTLFARSRAGALEPRIFEIARRLAAGVRAPTLDR